MKYLPPSIRGNVHLLGMSGLAIAAAASRFVGQRSYQGTFADDFYYYLAVADSLAQGHGSTFFGSETNGYHPLWMLCLTLIVRVFGSGTPGFVAVSLLIAH